jgi:hypothetical protein
MDVRSDDAPSTAVVQDKPAEAPVRLSRYGGDVLAFAALGCAARLIVRHKWTQ